MPQLAPPARVVLVGSATHHGDFAHTGGMVPPPRWSSPEELATPGTTAEHRTSTAGKRAYVTSKLGVVHLVHELARRLPAGVDAYTFDPGMMPGTALAREGTRWERILWHTVMHGARLLPWATSPAGAAAHLAEVLTGPRPADSGAYLELGRPARSSDESYDEQREAELWEVADRLVRR